MVDTRTVSEQIGTIDVSVDNDLTGEISMGDFTPCKLFTPSALTSTSLTFLVKDDKEDVFRELRDSAGNAVSLTVTTSGCYILEPYDFAGIESFKIKSGASEGADRNFTVVGIRAGNK